MQTPPDWHESEEFWEIAEPIMFDENRLLMSGAEVENLLRLTGVKEESSVLDLCCGPGRHAIELSKRNFRVTGVDRTERYLESARASGAKVDWRRADAREFVEPLAFDLVLNLYTSFGYFASPEEDRKVALNIYQSLKEGGKLVLSTLSKETIARGFVEHSWDERGDYMVLEHRTLHSEFRAVENQWIVLKGDTRREVGFIVRLYSASEMRVLLEGVGFSHVRFYGSLAGTRYDQNADRMVVVATKG